MLPQRLAHDIKPTGEGRIAEAVLAFPGPACADGSRVRLFRIDELGLSLGQGRGKGRDRFTGPGHGVRAKRSKSGAVSFDVLEMEATHAPVQ